MTCLRCNDTTEIVVCRPDGRAGCSHINDLHIPCPDCIWTPCGTSHDPGAPCPECLALAADAARDAHLETL